MKRNTALLLVGSLLLSAVPVLAHHSFAAVFDQTKKVSLTGTVTKMDWMNPHIWFYFDMKDASGKTVSWQCEGGPPNSLVRQGWTRSSLKPGDQISVEGFRAKDGSNTCNANSIKTADGKRLFAGSSAPEAQ